MKVYLVGGAVRDQLLGLTIKERDWVVVGAQPDELIKLGYRQVGKGFPVFLHPETQEEYALARTEKKFGAGYYGFNCDASPTISLEEDLLRRDLTINAMAMDSEGRLIDPYGGKKDLQDKVLRHVSSAFVEDPVRVLRIARFMARFQRLGFQLAASTRLLIQKMVRSGELEHLVVERVWQEWQQSLEEPNPEAFITTLRSCGALRVVLPEIDALFGIPNSPSIYLEVDTGLHSLNVLQQAVNLSSDPIIRFAALVHDLHKIAAPFSAWLQQTQYTQIDAKEIETVCKRLALPNRYQKLALLVSKWHLAIQDIGQLDGEIILTIFSETQAWQQDELFAQLLLVCKAIASQTKNDHHDYRQAKVWSVLLAECRKVTAQKFIEQGYTGNAIKEALYSARLACLERIRANEE